VIVDFHTHVFPAEVVKQRERFLYADPTFRELYEHPKATLATAIDLLESMDNSGVDVSVALGFAWASVENCRIHNNELIDVAKGSRGRIVPFCTLPLAAGMEAVEHEFLRCVDAGVRGFGELRPDNHGFDLAGTAGRRLGQMAAATGAMLLFHASEPVGHPYAGKQGMGIGALYEFIVEHPRVRVIAAHWGGGLPFYALMPEVKLALHNTAFDTAATSLLYNPGVYADVTRLTGATSIVFGSDYPLLTQKRSRERIEATALPASDVAAILGGNAARLLGLESATL
jgi:predicted TIM-barrel fold metal-dependent hydrolase